MTGYFYIDANKQQRGPFSFSELLQQNIQTNTMVWCSGMTDWTEAGTINDLAYLFNSSIPMPNETQDEPQQNRNSQIQQPQQQSSTPTSGTFANMNSGGYRPNPSQNRNTFKANNNNITDIRPMPKNWLVESILVTICCCLPFGIAGIVYATKVESLYYAGDYEAAEQAAKDAKKWTIIGFFSVFILVALYFIFIFFFGFLGIIASGF